MMVDGVLLLVLLLPTVAAALANAALLDTRRAKQLESTVKQAASSILIVDGENVRGKSLFQLSHTQLMARLARWSARHKLADRVVLLVFSGWPGIITGSGRAFRVLGTARGREGYGWVLRVDRLDAHRRGERVCSG